MPDYLWYYRARKTGEALEVAIYTRDMLMEGNRYPRYRVFLHDGKYDTWDEAKEKWRSSTIERLEYLRPDEEWQEYMFYAERFVWMTDREHRILTEYVKNGKECPRAAVQYWQDYKKNRQELDRIDEEMSLVPRMPRDFDRWAEKEQCRSTYSTMRGERSRRGTARTAKGKCRSESRDTTDRGNALLQARSHI